MENLIRNNLSDILEFSFKNTNQAIYILDKGGKILYANNIAFEQLGYTFDELLELHVWDIDAVVNTKEKYFEAVKSFQENDNLDKSHILENFHRKKNGEAFPVEINSSFIKLADEEILISYVQDISDRQKRNEEIKLYFELINSSQDLIFLVNHTTGKIEFVNEAVCNKLGFSLDELKGKSISEIRKPMEEKDNIKLPEVFKKLQETSYMTTFGKYITKNSEEILVETSLHLKKHNNEKYIVAVSRDISEKINMELEKEKLNIKLKDYNITLELEIEKVKKELIEHENIMKRQSKLAAMGEMLENISHQWRQPLSVISVLSTGITFQNENGILKEEILTNGLNEINEQVQYLSKTIDDFRDFFKPEKERNRFKLEPLISKTVKLSKARYDKNLIKFKFHIEDIELLTYENELSQVLLNLIDNAKDALAQKEYNKYVLIETRLDENSLYISVKDNAGGIDNHVINRIFEPYFTTKHKSQGTGIGLYMSKNIVDHMHGELIAYNTEISFEGSVYKGACFEIRLPLS
jgi:PAS domain S-box-containing protein